MFYLPDYIRFAADYVDDPEAFDLEAIALELRDRLDGADPDTMDADEFTEIVQAYQL